MQTYTFNAYPALDKSYAQGIQVEFEDDRHCIIVGEYDDSPRVFFDTTPSLRPQLEKGSVGQEIDIMNQADYHPKKKNGSYSNVIANEKDPTDQRILLLVYADDIDKNFDSRNILASEEIKGKKTCALVIVQRNKYISVYIGKNTYSIINIGNRKIIVKKRLTNE